MLRAILFTVLAVNAASVLSADAEQKPAPSKPDPLVQDNAGRTPTSPDAQVYFVWPHNGTVIYGGKFWVRMGLRNMGVAPKGVKMANVGHHHLVVDKELPPFSEQIPNDRNHLHFGAGETEARVELPPGKHTLQLLLGDHDHYPHNPPVYSKKITVIVR